MSITLMTKYQIENKKTKYKYALYGGLQNKNIELENLELFCYFRDKKAMLKHKDRFINDYSNQKEYQYYKFKIINV